MAHLTSSRHPDYDAWAPFWRLARQAYEGSEEIKAEGTAYLPMPGGFRQAPDPEAAYAAYVERAVYPEIIAPTIRGMAGVMHAKPASYELPSSMEYLLEEASRDNLTLDALHRRITREVLQVGRYGLLADMPAEGVPLAYIAGYTAECIVNWDTGEDGRLNMVLLNESGYERDPETYEWDVARAWRLLELDEAGLYVVRRFREEGGNIIELEPVEPVMAGGARLDFIPFTFIDSNDLTPEPDEIPLLPLAKATISIYRLEADYRRALYLTAQPTPVIIGAFDEFQDPPPMTIGSAVPWIIPPPGDAKFLEFSGAALAAQRQAILDEMERAVQLGARLLADQTGQQESGEARRLRYASESATLTSIAQNVASGLEAVLRHIAVWTGADPDSVAITPNLQFNETRLAPQEVDALVRAWQAGGFSYDTLFSNMQRGGIVADDRTLEEEQEAIEREGGGLGLIGREAEADAFSE